MTANFPSKLHNKTNHIFDVDDCLFDRTNGIHKAIKINIVDTFNAIANTHPSYRQDFIETVRRLGRHNDFDVNDVKYTDLEAAFLPIISTTKNQFSDNFYSALDQYYAVDYSVIDKNDALVSAFDQARNKGMEIFIYTNGPSHPHAGEELHAQRVLDRLGFDQDWIEYLRPRTHDLLKSTFLGNGKPYTDSFVQMLSSFNLDPRDSVFYDDTVPNLVTADKLGIATVWPWLTNEDAPQALEDLASSINAYKTDDTAQTFIQAINAYTPKAP